MHDAPDSSPNNLRVEMEDILDPDERTNDEVEERRTADHDGEFYDDDRDQDGDTMPLPPLRYDIYHKISYTVHTLDWSLYFKNNLTTSATPVWQILWNSRPLRAFKSQKSLKMR